MATTDFKDYYSILGVSKTATADEIKKSFRKPILSSHCRYIKLTQTYPNNSSCLGINSVFTSCFTESLTDELLGGCDSPQANPVQLTVFG